MISSSDLALLLQYLQVPELKWDLRPEWKSSTPNHREEIHRAKKQLPENWFSSISHCGKAGGFVAVPAPFRIGFDIEEIARVSDQAAKRVCDDPEIEFAEAPSASSLWVAKEAAFKGLFEINQPTTVSEIEIGPWEIKSKHMECFKVRSVEYQRTPDACGAVLHMGEVKLSFFALNSQLWSCETEKSNRTK